MRKYFLYGIEFGINNFKQIKSHRKILNGLVLIAKKTWTLIGHLENIFYLGVNQQCLI